MDDDQTLGGQDQSMRQSLNKTFSRYHYVGVRNVTSKDIEYTVALEQNEILGMSQADPMNEEQMSRQNSGQFQPNDGPQRHQKIVKAVIKAGEKKMLLGEAAYVVVPRVFNSFVREKYGTTKQGLARLRNPVLHKEMIPKIVEGPIINNVGEAMQTFVDSQIGKIEGFTDVQTSPSKGFSDPAVLAKAQATREANKAAKAQAG